MFEPCPCGRGAVYHQCCGRLHLGRAAAASAEELMRARYSAFARRDAAFLLKSWSAATRPDSVAFDPAQVWTSLEVGRVTEDGPDAATVRFTARARRGGVAEAHREIGRFRREGGVWVYLDGRPG